jgi:murein DD-endopeptidase MepM/ murein hydrolase activator NlpD
MQFRLAKRRKSALDEPIIPTKKRLNLKYHVGGITRKFFRYIFEHKAVKKLLGANIALMLVASSFVPTLASNEPKVLGTSVIRTETPITTMVSIQNPVQNIKITQGYKFFHPGLDLDGETGDQIKPIKAGVVEYAESESFGYGKHIIVDHGDNLKTLYAHLSKINVKAGDTVDTNTTIGLMGSTGHSTGSHLHFEVRQNGLPINPLSILPK